MCFWRSDEVFGDDHDWIQQGPLNHADQYGITKAAVNQWCACDNKQWVKIN